MTAATDPLTERDLAGFRLAHAAMRREFGRLAAAAHAATDTRRVALLDDQIALVTELLHHHHSGEDTSLWPRLRARVPDIAADLDRLEADHAQIDPLIERAADRDVPLRRRADTLAELHELVNAHLDREERTAVPRFLTDITRPEWEALADRMNRETDRRRLPLLFGWLASAATAEQRAAALAGVPVVPRVLFRLVWWPSYRRRFRAMYGDAPMPGPAPVPMPGPASVSDVGSPPAQQPVGSHS